MSAQNRAWAAAESRTIRMFIAAGLEAGLSHSDACRLAIAVYQEIDVQARHTDDEHELDPLSPAALRDIRAYCLAVLRSGTTFKSFEIANRAVSAWRQAKVDLARLRRQWDREGVTRRLRLQKVRQAAAAKVGARTVGGGGL